MDGILQPPSVTMFDAVASAISLMVYLDTALIVLARRPREAYARVFLVVALTTSVPYAVTFLQWWKGAGVYTPPVIALMTAAFCIGSAALFHFTQVFPWRRPWIRAHGRWLVLAYAVPVIPVAPAAWILGTVLSALQSDAGSGGIGAVGGLSEALILLASLPPFLFIGVVLPLAGIVSLVKSWKEAKETSNEPARKTTFWMLISQLAGGVLAILVLPLLRLAGVPPLWSTIFAGFAYAFALIMPYAFLAARGFGDAPGSTPQLHNSATPK